MAKKKFKTKYKKNKRLKTKPITRKDGIKQRYWVRNPNYFTKEISLERAKEVHEKRSKQAQRMDEQQTSEKVLDKPTKEWEEDSNLMDVKGIDTVKMSKIKINEDDEFTIAFTEVDEIDAWGMDEKEVRVLKMIYDDPAKAEEAFIDDPYEYGPTLRNTKDYKINGEWIIDFDENDKTWDINKDFEPYLKKILKERNLDKKPI